MHREVLRGEIRQARAVFLEEVEADVLRPARHQPFGRLGRKVGRLCEVIGPPAIHRVRPVRAQQHDVARLHVVGAASLQIVDRDRVIRPGERQVDHHGLAHHLVEGDLGGGDAVLEDVQGRVDVRAGVQALVHARDLPEARAAPVRRDFEPHVRRGRGECRVVDGHGEIDVALHGHGLRRSRWARRSTSSRAQVIFSGDITSFSAND